MGKLLFSLFALLLLPTAAAAQKFEIPWHGVDAGGEMFSTGEEWTSSRTVGQREVETTTPKEGGSWSLTKDFGVLSSLDDDLLFNDGFELYPCTAPPEIQVRLVDPPPPVVWGRALLTLDASASTVSYCGVEVPIAAIGPAAFENCGPPEQACILFEWSCTGATADQRTVCNRATDGWDQAAYSADYSYVTIDWYPLTYVRYTITLAIYEVGFDGSFTQNSEKSWSFDSDAMPPPGVQE